MLTLLLALSLGAAEKPKLVVLELTAGAGVEDSLTAPLTEAITNEVQARGYFDVMSSRDVKALIGMERQRELMGCSDASKSCMTEISGALGARFILSGSLSKLGDAWQLTLSALDSQKAQPLGRATRLARSLEALRTMLPFAVSEATATPAPPPPSRVLPWTLLGVGAAASLFGVVWGALSFSQEQQLAAVLDTGANTPGVLGTRDSYAAQLKSIETQRWVAVGALGVGVASLIIGAVLMPSDGGSTAIAVVPTGNGLGLAGRF
ncbi:MAG: hypothetical protein ACO1OB_28510 [Archangium sp.]